SALNTYSAFLIGKKDFRRGFLYSLSANLPYYAAMAIAAALFQEAIPVLIANLLANALTLYAAYWVTLRTYTPSTTKDASAITYGKHLSLMNFPGIVLGQADNVLVFHFLGAPALAVYGLATAIPDNLGRLLKFLPVAALPKFSVQSDQNIRSSLL